MKFDLFACLCFDLDFLLSAPRCLNSMQQPAIHLLKHLIKAHIQTHSPKQLQVALADEACGSI
jgi:hypothetical protein